MRGAGPADLVVETMRTFDVDRSKIEKYDVVPGTSWGTFGRGKKLRMRLSCGHTDYRNYSEGLPKTMTVVCSECIYQAMRQKMKNRES